MGRDSSPRRFFLRFAEDRFAKRRAELEKAAGSSRRGSRVDDPAAYHAEAILYLPATARYAHLLNLPEGTDIGLGVNDAMRAIERDNPHMAGVLPKSYQIFDSRLLAELLKTLSSIPSGLSGDAFGKIYEYFLGTFAMSEGQKGGEPSGARSTALAARRVSVRPSCWNSRAFLERARCERCRKLDARHQCGGR